MSKPRRADVRQRRRADGQVLIVYAAVLPFIFIVALLVVDGSKLFVGKRQLQNAADAAVLAAARELNDTDTPCTGTCEINVRSVASEYSVDNGGPPIDHACANDLDANCYKTPYGTTGTPNRSVQVRLQTDVSTFFGGVVSALSRGSRTDFQPAARAAAGQTTTASGGRNAVAFANNPTACPAINYSGAGGGFIGALETNGGVTISGTSDKTIDYLSVGKKDTCFHNDAPATINHPVMGPFSPKPWPVPLPAVPTPGSGCTALVATTHNSTVTRRSRGSGVATVRAAGHGLVAGDHVTVTGVSPSSFNGTFLVSAVPSPMTFQYDQAGLPDVGSAGSGGSVTSSSATISAGWEHSHPPGIYCLTGTAATLFLAGPDLSGGAGYTFFVPFLNIQGGSYKNYPPPSGQPLTLFYASGSVGSDDLLIHGTGASVTGDIFAPNGQVALEGEGASAGNGFVEADTLSITGNSANYAGTGPNIGGTTSIALALLE
jgi:hypothetical protein